ncbi:hypothetical protein H2200_012530 [Cladophialophora chaetospira]|uniref:Ubiquitin-like domain-containing protein n=1 Tax=Cladophialophora chaetospira TaxID=386627 RepID=A0AA39CC30_9EURO|nr:hypothetical protein H2200_012530 [Cladophialophora chaetospira]
MAETFDSIKVVNQDGTHELDVRNVPRVQRLELFKSRVAVELSQAERKYVNPADLDLFVFSEKMEDGDRTLADYGLKDEQPTDLLRATQGAIVTRIDHFNGARNRTQSSAPSNNTEANLPPYPGLPGKTLDNVFVKLDHRTITLHGLTTNSTIQDLYDKLKEETKISQANTGLIFGSKTLKTSLTFQDVGIGNDSTIFVFDKLPGGC